MCKRVFHLLTGALPFRTSPEIAISNGYVNVLLWSLRFGILIYFLWDLLVNKSFLERDNMAQIDVSLSNKQDLTFFKELDDLINVPNTSDCLAFGKLQPIGNTRKRYQLQSTTTAKSVLPHYNATVTSVT